MLSRAQDSASFIDTVLCRNASHPVNVSFNSLSTNYLTHGMFQGVLMADVNEFSASDEELGYSVVRTKSRPSEDFPFTPFFRRDQDLADEALRLLWQSDLAQCGSLISDLEEQQVSERQSSYGLQMAPVFAWTRRVLASMGHVPKYLDYLPWIRYMVGAESAAQGLLTSTMSQTGRKTNNSQKALYERLIRLDKAELKALANTALTFSEDS